MTLKMWEDVCRKLSLTSKMREKRNMWQDWHFNVTVRLRGALEAHGRNAPEGITHTPPLEIYVSPTGRGQDCVFISTQDNADVRPSDLLGKA